MDSQLENGLPGHLLVTQLCGRFAGGSLAPPGCLCARSLDTQSWWCNTAHQAMAAEQGWSGCVASAGHSPNRIDQQFYRGALCSVAALSVLQLVCTLTAVLAVADPTLAHNVCCRVGVCRVLLECVSSYCTIVICFVGVSPADSGGIVAWPNNMQAQRVNTCVQAAPIDLTDDRAFVTVRNAYLTSIT